MKLKVQPFIDGTELMEVDMMSVDFAESSIEFISFNGDRQYNVLSKSDLHKVIDKISTGVNERLKVIDISKWL